MRLDEDNTNDDNTYSIERDTKGVLLTGKVSIDSLTNLVESMEFNPNSYLADLHKDLDRFGTKDVNNCQLGVTLRRVKKTKATDLHNDEMIWEIGGEVGYSWSFGQKTFRRLNKFKRMTESMHLEKHIRIYVHVSDEARDDGAWVNKILQYFNKEKGEN